MAAQIVVQSGIASGGSLWIEKSVVRIGSSRQSDLQIPVASLAEHALTIEFRQQKYYIHNRSSDIYYVGTHSIAPGGTQLWHDTDILELTDGIELTLDLDVQPDSASPRSADRSSPTPAGPDDFQMLRSASPTDRSRGPTPGEKSSRGVVLQLLVIASCVLLGTGLLARHFLQGKFEPSDTVAFGDVVRAGLADRSMVPETVLRQLQHAEAARVRGNQELAHQRYRRLRRLLMSNEDAPKRAVKIETDLSETDLSETDLNETDLNDISETNVMEQLKRLVDQRLQELDE